MAYHNRIIHTARPLEKPSRFSLMMALVMVAFVLAPPMLRAEPVPATPSKTMAEPLTIQDDDDEEMGDRINFEPFIFTVIKNNKPYLQVTVIVQGVIKEGLDATIYQTQKPMMQAAILDMLSRLAYKKFRIGKRMDPGMVAQYFQAAVDRKLKKKGAVKLYISQIGQKAL